MGENGDREERQEEQKSMKGDKNGIGERIAEREEG